MASLTTASVADVCLAAKRAARRLAAVDSRTKDGALLAIADALEARVDEVLEANARDLEAGRGALGGAAHLPYRRYGGGHGPKG